MGGTTRWVPAVAPADTVPRGESGGITVGARVEGYWATSTHAGKMSVLHFTVLQV